MARKYGWICARRVNSTEKTEDERADISIYTVYYCIRLDLILYGQTDVLNALGLVSKSMAEKDQNLNQLELVRSRATAARQGIFGEIKVTLRLMEGSTEFVQWGTLHRTSLVYNTEMNRNKFRDTLLPLIWTVGPDDSKYQIVPGSITEKKLKRTTPNFG